MAAFVYILTNYHKTILYTGSTVDLPLRIQQHANGKFPGFSKKYRCHYLVYYEKYDDINLAISRERQIKKRNRKKKEQLINRFNPEWKFLNKSVHQLEKEDL